MILEFLAKLENAYKFFSMLDYALTLIGVAFIVYAFFVFFLTTFCLLRTKNLHPLKAIHAISITEVYAFVCGIFGIILILNIYNLLFFKILLFLIIVIFNAITVTRLIAKTAYFYDLKQSKTQEVQE